MIETIVNFELEGQYSQSGRWGMILSERQEADARREMAAYRQWSLGMSTGWKAFRVTKVKTTREVLPE